MGGLPKWRRCETSGAYSFLGRDAGGSLLCCEHGLSPERALIQVGWVERQQPRDEAAERRNNATVSGNRARPQEHQE